MHFRCPNCRQHIAFDDSGELDDPTLSELTCPTCNSVVPLALDDPVGDPPGESLQLDGFEIREVLGRGSFGIVYKAWDEQLQRLVAVKVPRPGRICGQTGAKFLREARAAAGVSHPGVVSVLEIGQYEDGYYIVTEYIDGVTLSEWLRQSPCSIPQAVELLITLCEAVQAAHDHQVIHRDLKPGNILMDLRGQPHITDFGLAKRVEGGDVTVTRDGQLLGTPAYMSPEQARGDVDAIGTHSDVYALGVILYEMLTDRKPFTATDSGTLIYRILNDPPPPPRSLRRTIDRDLETICLCALDKQPQRRYASARDFADDLQRYRKGEPIRARPVGYPERVLKFVRRNALVSFLTAVLLVILAIWAFRPQSIPEGHVLVRIDTVPSAEWIRFIPYHRVLRIPLRNVTPRETRGGRVIAVPAGFYRVQAGDSSGRYHEVWRTVENTTQDSIESLYPHRRWKVDESGTIELPSFRLFADADITIPLTPVRGNQFDVGYIPHAGDFNALHTQTIPDLLAGTGEVSMKDFRRMMRVPCDPLENSPTWLDRINRQFGSRSAVPDNSPVTGYPLDVAIMFCEFAGGRLPSGGEWEYLAIMNAGQQAIVRTAGSPSMSDANRQVIPVDSPGFAPGALNLFHMDDSVAEFTDSVMADYLALHPLSFPEPLRKHSDEVAAFAEGLPMPPECEIRGAPRSWARPLRDGESTSEPGESAERFSASPLRNRFGAPAIVNGDAAADEFARIGWRMVRTGRASRPNR